jgi:hypothetical protein
MGKGATEVAAMENDAPVVGIARYSEALLISYIAYYKKYIKIYFPPDPRFQSFVVAYL